MNEAFKFGSVTHFVYTNWKGETGKRRVLPIQLFWGVSEYHPTPQWLLHAYDLDKNDWRTFALTGIKTD